MSRVRFIQQGSGIQIGDTAKAFVISAEIANGTYSAGSDVFVSLIFSEAINTSGLTASNTSVTLNIGGNLRTAVYDASRSSQAGVVGEAANRLVFKYTVQPGESDIDGIALVGFEQGGQDRHGRGLAGAVRAQEPEHRARGQQLVVHLGCENDEAMAGKQRARALYRARQLENLREEDEAGELVAGGGHGHPQAALHLARGRRYRHRALGDTHGRSGARKRESSGVVEELGAPEMVSTAI
jgi:hypothetical protein